MAKGQKRSNRESKKPKQVKAKSHAAAASPVHAAMEAGGPKKGPKK